jgi:hypothetical protein
MFLQNIVNIFNGLHGDNKSCAVDGNIFYKINGILMQQDAKIQYYIPEDITLRNYRCRNLSNMI